MDSNLFSLYVTLKGAKQTCSLLGIPESSLIEFLPKTGSSSLDFFRKVNECIKELRDSTNLEHTADYFCISQDMVRALTEENYLAKFLSVAKEIIVAKIEKKCDKGVQVGKTEIGKFREAPLISSYNVQNPPFNVFQNYTNALVNSLPSMAYPQAVQPGLAIQGIQASQALQNLQFGQAVHNLQTRNSASSDGSVKAANAGGSTGGNSGKAASLPGVQKNIPQVTTGNEVLETNRITPQPANPSSPVPQSKPLSQSNTTYPKPNTACHLRKTVNINSFKDHRPVQGTIVNPDYSLKPSRPIWQFIK